MLTREDTVCDPLRVLGMTHFSPDCLSDTYEKIFSSQGFLCCCGVHCILAERVESCHGTRRCAEGGMLLIAFVALLADEGPLRAMPCSTLQHVAARCMVGLPWEGVEVSSPAPAPVQSTPIPGALCMSCLPTCYFGKASE